MGPPTARRGAVAARARSRRAPAPRRRPASRCRAAILRRAPPRRRRRAPARRRPGPRRSARRRHSSLPWSQASVPLVALLVLLQFFRSTPKEPRPQFQFLRAVAKHFEGAPHGVVLLTRTGRGPATPRRRPGFSACPGSSSVRLLVVVLFVVVPWSGCSSAPLRSWSGCCSSSRSGLSTVPRLCPGCSSPPVPVVCVILSCCSSFCWSPGSVVLLVLAAVDPRGVRLRRVAVGPAPRRAPARARRRSRWSESSGCYSSLCPGSSSLCPGSSPSVRLLRLGVVSACPGFSACSSARS